MRNIAYGILEGNEAGRPSRRVFTRLIVALIVLNGLAVILESNDALYAEFRPLFNAFEVFSVAIFTIEYLGPLESAPALPDHADGPGGPAGHPAFLSVAADSH